MRLKSAYREKPAENYPAPSVQIDDQPVQPSETTTVNFDTDTPAVAIVGEAGEPGDAVTEALQKAVEADEASEVLRRQLQHLHASEELQRHAARMMQPRLMSREEKLSAWRANGGDEGDIAFLESHPEMVDRHDLTVVAAEEAAQQGFERGTPQHREMTKEIFDQHLASLQTPQAQAAQPAPAFFAPPPEAPRSPATERPGQAAEPYRPRIRRESNPIVMRDATRQAGARARENENAHALRQRQHGGALRPA
jgi:hypothetical protein